MPVKKAVSKAPPKVSLRQASTAGSLDWMSGQVWDSTIRDLRGTESFKRFREMADHSPVIGACLLAIKMLTIRPSWSVKPGDDSEGERKRAEIIQSMMDDMSASWQDNLGGLVTPMLTYGFNYSEIVYKIRRGPDQKDPSYRSKFSDGLIGWRRWVNVRPETLDKWSLGDDGSIRGFWQLTRDYKSIFLPIEKALLFRTTDDSPQGRSMLLNAYLPWQFVKRIQEFEAIGIERDLCGIPVAEIPADYLDPEASAGDKAFVSALKTMLANLRRNSQEGIIFPMAYDDENNPVFKFHLLASGGMRQFDTNKVIERYERRMAMSLLADFILMGHERVGSLALSKDKTSLVGRSIEAILSIIADTINRHEIPRLYRYNGWPTTATSKLVPGEVEPVDLGVLGQYFRNLASVGLVTPDPGIEEYLREQGGAPEIDEEYMLGPDEVAQQIGAVPPPEPVLPGAGGDQDGDQPDDKPPSKPAKPKPKPKPKPKGK